MVRLLDSPTVLPLVLLFLLFLESCQTRELMLSGIVRVRDYKLSSRIGGTVKEILVGEGVEVKKSEVLVRFDDSKLQAQMKILEQELAQAEAQHKRLLEGATKEEIDRAKAELDIAEAQYKKALSGFRSEDISAAREQVNALSAKFKVAEREAERANRLFNEGVISESEYERALAERDAISAELKALKDNLEKLTVGLQTEDIEAAEAGVQARRAVLKNLLKGATKNDISVSEARVKQVKAEIARLELDIADCTVLSPVDGTTENIHVEVGEIAQPGTPVVTIIGTGDMWIEAYIPESYLSRISIGDKLKVVADTNPDAPFDAEVTFISREEEFTPRNIFTPEQRINQVYLIKLKPINPTFPLRGGVNVTVKVSVV